MKKILLLIVFIYMINNVNASTIFSIDEHNFIFDNSFSLSMSNNYIMAGDNNTSKISRLSPKKKEAFLENYFFDFAFWIFCLIIASYLYSFMKKNKE